MDLKELFKNNKFLLFVILIISIVISLIFPVHFEFSEDKSKLYLISLMVVDCFVWGIVFFLISYWVSILFKRRLNDKQIKITLITCFSIWWSLQVISHYGKGLLNSSL
jgi:nitrogen fixation/metabolism regulation signal transduction histidine kinase